MKRLDLMTDILLYEQLIDRLSREAASSIMLLKYLEKATRGLIGALEMAYRKKLITKREYEYIQEKAINLLGAIEKKDAKEVQYVLETLYPAIYRIESKFERILEKR